MKLNGFFIITICMTFLAAAHPAERSKPARKPNIVFILADDLGINDLACYGRRQHHTPNLDRLAASGVRFTSAYAASPLCSSSRAAILTGKDPARLHLTTYLPGRADCAAQLLQQPHIRPELPLEEKSLAEYMKAAGYATACIGKWHLGGPGFGPSEQGFDIYHPGHEVTLPSAAEGSKGEYDLTAAAESFIAAHRDQPFFLYLAHYSPHIPYSAQTNLIARNREAFEPVYAAVVETLDDTVGRLLARIEALGLTSNTIVVFTSDNGGLHVPEWNHERITHNTPFRAGKGFLYEGGLRVPLIVRWPDQTPAGRVVEVPMINTDWLPTLLELAGQPLPINLDGVSFAAAIRGRRWDREHTLFWHFPHYSNQGGRPGGAVRAGDWKLVENYEDGALELFNLRTDPGETDNMAPREPRQAQKLKKQLASWRTRLSVQTNARNPQADAALCRALYKDIDVSLFNPTTAEAGLKLRVLNWRRLMDEVVLPPAK